MRKRGVRDTAEIDHIGTGCTHLVRPAQYGVDIECRRINDLGEYTDVVAGQVEVTSSLSKIGRQVFKLIRAALERNAEFSTQVIEVGTAAPRHQHATCLQWAWQAAFDNRSRHQCRNLNPDIDHRPGEPRIVHADQELLQPRLGKMAGEEGDMFGHVSSRFRRESCVPSSASVSTTATSLNDFSRAVLSRSIWRG